MSLDLSFNNTFKSGPDGSFNACVGNNGWQELESYGDGYDEAVKVIYEAMISNSGLLDIMIHPMVFSARHRIELFLKASIKLIDKLRQDPKISDTKLIKTHDLKSLWNIYENLANNCDSRLKVHIDNQKEIVLEFAEIDPTAETFRYPYSQSDQKHLIKTPVINIKSFYKRYTELSEDMRNMTYLLDCLEGEYQQNTFTKKLSRFEISCIAEELPLRVKWSENEFEDIKKRIIEKYYLSAKDFSKALNVIQEHREFSMLIGIEKPIEYLSPEKMKKAIALIREVHEESKGFNIQKPDFCNVKFKKANSIFIKEFNKSEVTCLYTMIEHGLSYYYSESFDFLYNSYEKSEDKKDMIMDLFKNNSIQRIRQSLEKLGQKSLLEVI